MSEASRRLGDVARLLERIESDYQQNKVDLKSIGLKSLFVSLKECTSPETLDQVAQAFGLGCNLLVNKLQRIQSFIQMMDDPEKVLNFFSEQFDFDTSTQFISPFVIPQCEFPGLSVNFLLTALGRLKNLQHNPIVISPPEVQPPLDNFEILLPTKRFEEIKQDLLAEIGVHRQMPIIELLSRYAVAEKYYETFMAILHLIQDGRVRYNPSNQGLEVVRSE